MSDKVNPVKKIFFDPEKWNFFFEKSENFDPIFFFAQTIEHASKRTPIEFGGDRTMFWAKFWAKTEKKFQCQNRKKKVPLSSKKNLGIR